MENLKLCNISKNQLPRSILKGDMRVLLPFDLEKGKFLSYISTNLSYEVEIWYVYRVRALNVPFGGLNFSA